MKKSTIIKSALFLVCFSWANAQEVVVKDDAKTVVMTKTEYNDFIAKIKELRRQRLALKNQKTVQVVKSKQTSNHLTDSELLRELNNKVNYLLYSRGSSDVRTDYIPMQNQGDKSNDNAYLALLQARIDDLRSKVNAKNTTAQPSYTSEFDALNQKIAELQNKLNQQPSTNTVTISNNSKYDELLEKYSNYRKAYFFGNNSATVSTSDYYSIDEVANIARQEAPHIKVQLKGFASKVGSPIYNAKLSKKRTESVKQLLINKGVTPSSIEVLPLGEDHVAYSEAQARRVEVSLLIKK